MVVRATVVIYLSQSELTSEDETLTRHIFFLEFNDEYQDLTKYSLIQQLNLPQLTSEELLAMKYPFSVHPKCCTNHSNCVTAINAC